MDSMGAFIMGQTHMHSRLKVFDWDKAAKRIVEEKPIEASAGLSQDWDWTGGVIYTAEHGIENEYTYLASTWATPELDMDGKVESCWRWKDETDGWDSGTKWPDSAVAILGTQVIGTTIDVEFKEIKGELNG